MVRKAYVLATCQAYLTCHLLMHFCIKKKHPLCRVTTPRPSVSRSVEGRSSLLRPGGFQASRVCPSLARSPRRLGIPHDSRRRPDKGTKPHEQSLGRYSSERGCSAEHRGTTLEREIEDSDAPRKPGPDSPRIRPDDQCHEAETQALEDA